MKENNNEKKQIVITGVTVLKFVGALSGILGIVMIITNLLGVTDLAWLNVGLLFVAPALIFVITTKKPEEK